MRDALLRDPALAGVTIDTISKGEEEPAVPNAATEEEHRRNRRAEFRLDCTPRR